MAAGIAQRENQAAQARERLRQLSHQSKARIRVTLGALPVFRPVRETEEAPRIPAGLYRPPRGALDSDSLDRAKIDLNSREGFVSSLSRLGFVYAHRGNLDEAESHYRMMLDMNKHLHNETGMATDHANLGGLYAQQGKYRDAREELKKALALYEKAGESESAQVVNEWLSELDKGESARSTQG